MGNSLYINKETDEKMSSFRDSYSDIHFYLASVVCVFGVISNILNIIVLTRKNMKTSTNFILMILAISDGLINVIYVPYLIIQNDLSYKSAQYTYAFVVLTMMFHTVSVWITVTLAIFRYIAIQFPLQQMRYCNKKRIKLTVALVIFLCIFISIPNTLNYKIKSTEFMNKSGYFLVMSDHNVLGIKLSTVSFWIVAVMVKFLPSLLLTIFSVLLITALRRSNKRRYKLCYTVDKSTCTNNGTIPKLQQHLNKGNGATKLIITVVVLFVLTTLPQAILNLLSGISEAVFYHVYVHVGDLMDDLTLINSAINFLIYCTMSRKFRSTFSDIFCKICTYRRSDQINGV